MDDIYNSYIELLKEVSGNKSKPKIIEKAIQKKDTQILDKKKISREALTVFFLAQAKFPDFFQYEPETIKSKLNLDLMELEELLCCQNIWHNLTPFEDWHIFEKTVCVLNQRHSNFLITQDINPSEICWAIKSMRRIDDQSLFSDEVLEYISVILHHEGFITAPDILKTEQSYTGLGVDFFLKQLNKHHEYHDYKSKNEIFNNINNYVSDRQVKFEHESKEEKV